MRIKSLKIKNNFFGWEFEEINFSSSLTLLVGASGVGKTQILKAVDALQNIINGGVINGFEWEITFSTIKNKEFTWSGAFSTVEDRPFQSNDNYVNGEGINSKPIILSEKLREKGTEHYLIERNKDTIKFNGQSMPKLSSSESLISILQEENVFREILFEFDKMILKDNAHQKIETIDFPARALEYLPIVYNTFEKIKNSHEPILKKLFICSVLKLPIFNTIKSKFIDIFPQVEDLNIEAVKSFQDPVFGRIMMLILSIKEKYVDKWIAQDRISSGMMRTIMHIAELYLSNEGSVILIDEFENSLGVNCIDVLTEDLVHNDSDLQFIATSHHPYIINNIPYEHWKIVSRKGGQITIKNAAAYNLGRSKQDAFIKLTKILEKSIAQ